MYTDEQLQALKAALATGVTRVRFGEREIEYRTIEELKTAISTIEAELAKGGGAIPVRQIRVSTDKGL